ncbi:hybrid sensor histidine kinase/response regulator transcription factor [Sinomicrobium soli]|uniref:hybrid sensor histidine kinase/response regulator transcription factor n=1 Tax=Sinomicrobium sp. N-1-3-6 TaxID=2219864 RepID=UPI000DCEFB33|nr:hybrid sensor histidine kinase/response regulator transcription factor [Sinomicrobium sp. N-1-3-6]RAV28206.1 hybrid sensor histidine kinase/response regulator [Sinomicrobium sp. N-1-3-6]
MRIRYYIYLAITLFGFIKYGIAQDPKNLPKELKFRHYTSSHGLSQRSVMAIEQDSKGYLWFGTRDGLNKFDGDKFTIYKHSDDDTTSLSNNNVHTIYEDTRGNLWIGTQNGLNRYHPKTDSFIRYKHSKKDNSITDNIIWGITQLNPELLWVATNNGISQINLSNDIITRIYQKENSSGFPGDNNNRSFLKTGKDSLWICNTTYISIYHHSTGSFEYINYPKKEDNDIHINGRPTLLRDHNNTIWLGYEGGLAIYDTVLRIFKDVELEGKKIIGAPVRSICEDLNGNLWIGSYDGLFILNSDRSGARYISHDENRATSLSQNSIYKIIKDSRGDMWIGTWAGGINYYNKDNGAFRNISFGSARNKLNYKVVSGMAEDRSGNLWIGTEGGGINFYNRETKRFSYYKHDPGNRKSLTANNVKAIIIDSKGFIWVGMHDGGVNFLDPGKTPFEFKEIDFPESHNISLKGYKVLTLLEDRNGNIWIGTLTGGLMYYNVQSGILSKIDDDIRTVMSIVRTGNPDLLLVGGYNSGLKTIDINTREIRNISLENTDRKDTPLYINCIFVDNYNNYWIGTEGQGLYMYDTNIHKTKAYGLKEGLPNDIIYGILSDDNGNLWISTNNGISRLNIESGNIKNFSHADGLQGNEFNYGSALKTRNNALFFGGTNGLTYFNPIEIRKNTYIPSIDITNIEVNNVPYAHITDSIRQVTLKYNENNFSLDFTALSYMQPEKNEFAYMLQGFDKDWKYVGKQRKAIYTNIPRGKYVFKVKGANNDGVWNEEGDTLPIRVLPAPWKTWWAYLLYAALLTGISVYIRKLIVLRIREKKEKERLEEINRLKLRLFTDVSHDFRTPLTLITGPLEKMISQKAGDHRIRQQHEIMYRNARMLLQLINQILDFRKSEAGKLTLQASENNIVPFVGNVKKSFDALAEHKNISFDLISENERIPVWFDRIKLQKILFNLLSNAFKYTDSGKRVCIRISTESDQRQATSADFVRIEIINFGNVIPRHQLKFIFERFYQLEHNSKEPGSGIGLALTKNLVDLHKGQIKVKSSESQGTRFIVLLPLGDKHLGKGERIDAPLPPDEDHTPVYVDIPGDSPGAMPSETPPVSAPGKDIPALLIVEDNREVREFIIGIFRDSYNIYTAGHGKEAVGITQKNVIDLIISDVSMPVMDGYELCNTIKTTLITSHIPVILLTAKTSEIHQEKGFDTGADAYITKPFNARLLQKRVDNLLKTRANLIRKFRNDIILKPKNLKITSTDETFLQKAISVVEEGYTDQNFNTAAFVARMNMSRTVLYTKIKALTGQNISTFIRTIRLKKAALLITQTKMNISQIAYEVGFNDLKYFRKCFKEFFKVTPSAYKRDHAETHNP